MGQGMYLEGSTRADTTYGIHNTLPESDHSADPRRATMLDLSRSMYNIVLSNLSARDSHRAHFTPRNAAKTTTVGHRSHNALDINESQTAHVTDNIQQNQYSLAIEAMTTQGKPT
jgi:hypothetical protein